LLRKQEVGFLVYLVDDKVKKEKSEMERIRQFGEWIIIGVENRENNSFDNSLFYL